jgi:hypothetical protein
MKTLSLSNAQVTLTNVSFGAAGQQLIAQVQYAEQSEPAELDLPSGAFWIWPMKRGTLTIAGTLSPNYAPLTPAVSGNEYDITVTSSSPAKTAQFDKAVFVGSNVSIDQIGEAMPALQVQYKFQIFVNDNQETGDYPA